MRRFYSNENIPLPVVEHLRSHGHDVLTSSEAGNANQRISDEDVLAFATETKRILITFNRRDFIRLHQIALQPHAGIVVCSEDIDFKALANRIHEAVSAVSELDHKLVRVLRPSQ